MLSPGVMIGPYEIQSMLGAGGMGEVYRARDTRLDRTVAVKILSQEFAADPQFRERFDREAKSISQLNHPNICTLYDVGESVVSHEASSPTAIRFLVMEFLEGETLANRLERGALKLEEALKIAGEISSALDEAHRAGIVHRDLKPGNVMLTRSGGKLLDFGLAKQTTSPLVSRRGSSVAAAAAASGALTSEGAIIGTFQYMAPEQLEGVEADARADIFAFGAILYEMVTGRKAFEGKTPISLITSILRDDPPPVSALLPVAPKALDRIIRACMAKDPDSRLRSTHDLSLQLKWLAEADAQGDPAPAVAPATRRKRSMDLTRVLGGALIVATVAATVLAVQLARQAPPAAAEQIQFTMPAPDDSVFFNQPTFAVSPDGRQIVFIATTPTAPMLFVRALGSLAVRPLPGTEQANFPFWSPDSRSVAFFAAGKLKKIQVGGGAPNVLCDAATGRGGTWNRDNIVLFAPSTTGPLLRVDAAGGSPTPATRLDESRGETTHKWPSFLPDGRHFLYAAVSGAQRPSETRVGSLDSREATTLFAGDSLTAYASGHLFFWRDGGVMAQPFDAGARRLSGEPVSVATPVGQGVGVGYVSFSASQTGVLVYSRGISRPISQPTWKDRAGRLVSTAGEPGDYLNIALAPDERRAAVALTTGTPENRDLWLIDFTRSGRVRLTSDPASETLPVWSPDGTRIIFGAVKAGASGLYVMKADGSGSEELLIKFDGQTNPLDWSRDERFLLYYNQSPKTGWDLWVLPLTGDKKPFPFLQTAFNEDNAAFAPDTKWIAYVSNESSRDEVYVQPFPATGAKYRVSSNGGTYPMWRGDGRELFFLSPDGTMMAASIKAGSGIEAGTPQALFPSGIPLLGNRHQYAVTKDGQRFLLNVPLGRSTPTPLTVVVNWQGGR